MMGVGKTTIGNLLSKKLKIPFEDLDSKIETKESLTINEIFDLKGEKYFRKIEEEEGLKTLEIGGKIIALGGGTFINKNVREKVKRLSLSIWLDLSPQEIFKRINKNKGRPLLLNANSITGVENIYLNRKKIYALADYKLDCALKSKNEIVREIEKIYETI